MTGKKFNKPGNFYLLRLSWRSARNCPQGNHGKTSGAPDWTLRKRHVAQEHDGSFNFSAACMFAGAEHPHTANQPKEIKFWYMEIINTIGRRKTSIARVYVKPGKGQIVVNQRELNVYFPSEILQTTVRQALTLFEGRCQLWRYRECRGGGSKGQAEAIRLGIARALVTMNSENSSRVEKRRSPYAWLQNGRA